MRSPFLDNRLDRRAFLRLLAAGAGVAAARSPLVTQAQATSQADFPLRAGQRAVATDDVNVRAGPSSEQPWVGMLPMNTGVDLLAGSDNGRWWRVAADTAVGYVNAAYLRPTGESSSSAVLDFHLDLPYSRQLTPVWCDPADIEMWLGYHQQLSDIPSYARQQEAWDWETSHNAGLTVDEWNCSPFAVASAAHHLIPDLGFDHFRYDSATSASRTLAWLLAHPDYREPSIALIWRGEHYVLIRGVRSLGDPSTDPASTLLGFYVADPNRYLATRLGEDRFVPIEQWLGEMLTPVTYLTPHTGRPGDRWQDRIVTIQRSWLADGPTLEGRLNAGGADYLSG